MNGKRKGGAFEREICKLFSLWVSGGKSSDIFWRSAMSGGRATVHHRRGVSVRQSGDMCAVAPEGHEFCDKWFVECKHVANANLAAFLLKGTGDTANFWKKAYQEAAKHHKRPMLIVKSRNPVFVVVWMDALKNEFPELTPCLESNQNGVDVYLLEDVLKVKRPMYALNEQGEFYAHTTRRRLASK